MTFNEMVSLFDYKCRRYFDNYSEAFQTKFDLRWNEYKDNLKWRMFVVMPINESIAFIPMYVPIIELYVLMNSTIFSLFSFFITKYKTLLHSNNNRSLSINM